MMRVDGCQTGLTGGAVRFGAILFLLLISVACTSKAAGAADRITPHTFSPNCTGNWDCSFHAPDKQDEPEPSDSELQTPDVGVDPIQALKPHGPIFIEGDVTDFTAAGIVSGTGTIDDPYVIRNWMIEVDDKRGIQIQNSNSFYLIENVFIRNTGASTAEGIVTNNARNIAVRNVTVTGASTGVRILAGSNISIDHSHIRMSFADGISMERTDYFTVTNSLIEYTRYHGITLRGPARGAMIARNEVAYPGYMMSAGYSGAEGIIAYVNVADLLFQENLVHHGAEDGIELVSITGAVVNGNVSRNNDDEGMDIYQSHNNQIIGNNLFDNGGEGLVLSSSHDNTIGNNLLRKNDIGLSFITLAGDAVPHGNVVWGPPVQNNRIDYGFPPIVLDTNTLNFAAVEDLSKFPKLTLSGQVYSRQPKLEPAEVVTVFGGRGLSGDQMQMGAPTKNGNWLWSQSEQHLMIGVVITSTPDLTFQTDNYYDPHIVTVESKGATAVPIQLQLDRPGQEGTLAFIHQDSRWGEAQFAGSEYWTDVFTGTGQIVWALSPATITDTLVSKLRSSVANSETVFDSLTDAEVDVVVENLGPTFVPPSLITFVASAAKDLGTSQAGDQVGEFGTSCSNLTATQISCSIPALRVGEAITIPVYIQADLVPNQLVLSVAIDNRVRDPNPLARVQEIELRRPSPIITGVTVAWGSMPQQVTIVGKNFWPDVLVTVNGAVIPVESVDEGNIRIQASLGSMREPLHVTVRNPDGQSTSIAIGGDLLFLPLVESPSS